MAHREEILESEGGLVRQLPTLPPITTGQVALSGSALLTALLVDVAVHMDGTVMFVSLLAVGVVARHSRDILDFSDATLNALLPGRNAQAAVDLTTHILQATGHEDEVDTEPLEEEERDQRPLAKLKRLVGIRTPVPERTATPKDERGDDIIDVPTAQAGPEPVQTVVSGPDAVFPHVAADKMLKWGVSVKFNRRFDPPINKILGAGALLTGTQGAGKSNLIGHTIASAAACDIPCFVVDFKNEFYPLRDIIQTAILCGHPNDAARAGAPYYPLTKDNAAEFAADLLENGYQAIFNMQSYRDYDEMAETLAEVLHALMDWSQSLEDEDERVPCLVITDEAHNFVPERSALSGLPLEEKSFTLLKKAYARMGNTGRSLGFTLIMATQRLANIAKWSIANLHIKVIMKQDELNDLKRCEEYLGKGMSEELMNLPAGRGYVLGLSKTAMQVQFDQQKARHVSKTPNVERAHKKFKQRQRATVSRVLARRIPGTKQYIPVTSNNNPLRPDQTPAEREISRRYARNVNSTNLDHSELENTDVTRVSYARKNESESAPQAGVSGQNGDVTSVTDWPTGWDEEKLKMLPFVYRAVGNIDRTLTGLELTTSQKNREFARTILKQQGLWKETK